MKLSKDQVKHIASLSHLYLSDEELSEYAEELLAILEYIDKLKEVNTENVLPVYQVANIYNGFRADEIKEFENPHKLIESAPEKDDNLIKIKAVFE